MPCAPLGERCGHEDISTRKMCTHFLAITSIAFMSSHDAFTLFLLKLSELSRSVMGMAHILVWI